MTGPDALKGPFATLNALKGTLGTLTVPRVPLSAGVPAADGGLA
jgi:hypothetical protein